MRYVRLWLGTFLVLDSCLDAYTGAKVQLYMTDITLFATILLIIAIVVLKEVYQFRRWLRFTRPVRTSYQERVRNAQSVSMYRPRA